MAFIDAVIMRLVWVLNGLMVVLYFSFDHLLSILLLVSALPFAIFTPGEHRPWAFASAGLAFAASLVAPTPFPLFLVVLSVAGWAALWLERYNRPATRWAAIKSLSIYAVFGLAVFFYNTTGLSAPVTTDPMMAQGKVYLNGMIGIAAYVAPIVFLYFTVQNIWAHPPQPGGSPEQLISTVRSRGTRR
jgi:hypothetical protein